MFEQDAGEAIFVTSENNWVANEILKCGIILIP